MVGMMMIGRGSMPGGEKLISVFRELNSGTDRAAAIVGGSVVESALQNAIEAQLHRDEKITDNLFRPSGALGAFATKIDLGFLTGIYGKKGRAELVAIKDIRNAFAHRLDIAGFEDQSIRDKAMGLIFGERYVMDARQPTPEKANPKLPIGAWPCWFAVQGRDEALESPRERFLLSVGALTYGLSMPLHVAMPSPYF